MMDTCLEYPALVPEFLPCLFSKLTKRADNKITCNVFVLTKARDHQSNYRAILHRQSIKSSVPNRAQCNSKCCKMDAMATRLLSSSKPPYYAAYCFFVKNFAIPGASFPAVFFFLTPLCPPELLLRIGGRPVDSLAKSRAKCMSSCSKRNRSKA